MSQRPGGIGPVASTPSRTAARSLEVVGPARKAAAGADHGERLGAGMRDGLEAGLAAPRS